MVRHIELATVHATTSLWLDVVTALSNLATLAATPKGRATRKVCHTLSIVLVRQLALEKSVAEVPVRYLSAVSLAHAVVLCAAAATTVTTTCDNVRMRERCQIVLLRPQRTRLKKPAQAKITTEGRRGASKSHAQRRRLGRPGPDDSRVQQLLHIASLASADEGRKTRRARAQLQPETLRRGSQIATQRRTTG